MEMMDANESKFRAAEFSPSSKKKGAKILTFKVN